jgi:hypothetical protein
MRLETAKYLYDVQSAAIALAGFVDGCDWADTRATPCCAPPWNASSKSSARR